MKELSFDAFYQLYQNEQLSLVDVREVEELDKDQLHYVICKSGMRSARACQFLAEQVYDVINVQGGMTAFENL
ncbi:Thiosulfate sulfurtransferase GlpE [Streptococcus oralis]|uniref:Thiosulfate sulfurtransferase GlpE n=1 Tax=Streptococcus oralis TaxID=1303 RepID=A0A428FZI8_STROR|nr:rhodanese-like domain-containing protein [Streptococcus oralis]RSJ68056.1 Thiosulfate sulfurtransferase GlpE [Streptococcus oralis]